MRRTLSNGRGRFLALAFLTLLADWGSKRLFAVSSPFWERSGERAWGMAGLILSVGIVLLIWRRLKQAAWAAPLGLLVGGIWGNSLDRLVYQGVRDGIPFWQWMTNVADLAIWAGLVILLWQQRPIKKPGSVARSDQVTS